MSGVDFIPWGLLALAVGLYAAAVLALIWAGRREGARALAGFIPDCALMVRRLLRRPEVAWWERAMLVALIAYLAFPLDLVPDFIPVAGQLDDAILVGAVLGVILRRHGRDAIVASWPGPDSSLRLVLRAARAG